MTAPAIIIAYRGPKAVFGIHLDQEEERHHGSACPVPEVLRLNLIAEDLPFDSARFEIFRCNSDGLLMADSRHQSANNPS